MNLRLELNNALPGRLADALKSVQVGEILNLLLVGGDVVVPALTTTAIATADATDLATVLVLANATKAKFNTLLTDVTAIRAALVSAGGATEVAVTVTANVATLAAQPQDLVAVVATAATTTGMKKLLQGPITGPRAIVPATGQAVWDGGVKVLFATADVVTAASFLYTKAADTTVSLFQREIGEQDGT